MPRFALAAVILWTGLASYRTPWAAASPDSPQTVPIRSVDTGTRLLLIGLDGADWQIAGPLIEAGKLPNLARLRREGAWGDLRSSQPMLSPLLWTSIATGKTPDQHGIIDFLVLDPRTGMKVPISSIYRRTKALWNIYTESGRTADFIAWWATWPAEAVNGHMVSERLAYSLFGFKSRPEDTLGLVYPPKFIDEVTPLRVREDSITLKDLQRFARITAADLTAARAKLKGDQTQAYADPINHLTRILASTRTYHAIALKLLAGGKRDIVSIYYQGIDETCHRFAQYIPPKSAWIDPAQFDKYSDVVKRFYEYQDTLIGELLKAAGPGVTVVLMSDHGFLNGSDRPEFPPDIELKAGQWHRLYGVLVLKGPPIRPGRLETNSLYDVTPTLLYLSGLPVALDMQGRPILDAVTPEFKAKYPLATIATYEDPSGRHAGSEGAIAAASDEVNEEMLAQLKSLGYISSADAGGAPPVPGEETPATLTNMLNKASLEMQKGDFKRSEEILRSILQKKPDHANTHASLSEVLEAQGRTEEARTEARTALNLMDDPPERLVERYAQLSRRLGRLDEAKSFFLRGTQLRAGRAEPWLGLGLAQSYSGDMPAAQASFLRALEMNPRSTTGVTGLYNIYETSGRPPEVLAAIRKAVSANPDSAAHHTLLGMLYTSLGDVGQAESELRRALELDPERDMTIASLGGLLMNSGRMEEARHVLERAVARKADQVEVRMALGQLYAKMSRFGEATRQMAEAARIDPSNAVAQGQLGMMYLMQNQDSLAMPRLERALQMDPAFYELHLHLAVLYHDAKRFDDCESQLKQAIAQRPDDPEPHRLLAGLYEELGRQDDLAKEVARLKELGAKQ
ncbi:MAG TPA: tetratricopeptide repeat protein [Patescibacteria group bacterium]|nr:tetratricopeptide repeat protein [Patescibacteria group bacterium]